jgi:RimJ/RimL family protein N-acetyltransferase
VTARATLRPLGVADLEAVYALWTDPAVRRPLWNDEEVSLERTRGVLAAAERHFVERRYGLWGVRDADGVFAGFAGCRPWPTGEPELVYGLAPAWWGRGLATEVAHAVLAHVFDTLEHPVVMAGTDPANQRSIHVMERVGMTFDWRGEMHGVDTVVYRLSRQRWRRLRASARSARVTDV